MSALQESRLAIFSYASYFLIMTKRIAVYRSHAELQTHDRRFAKSLSPEDRLDQVELLRIQAGKFLYEYPARLRRIIKVTRRTQG